MAKIKVNQGDIQALITFAIYNNRDGLANALREDPNCCMAIKIKDLCCKDLSKASNPELYRITWQYYDLYGIRGLKRILDRVRLASTNTAYFDALYKRFRGIPLEAETAAKFEPIQWLGDLLSGKEETVVSPGGLVSTEEPLLKPQIIIGFASLAIIMIVILLMLRK